MASFDNLKSEACQSIDQLSGELHGISKAIWSKPELAFQEHSAHDILCNFLEKQGFSVERQYKLKTAFRAVYEMGKGPNVAVLCEYDALPNIGHACGHNLIAEVGVAAGVGIKAALQEAKKHGNELGRVTVLGTPAEEGGAGKVLLINHGVFKDISFAMIAHPGIKTQIRVSNFLSRAKLNVKYLGRASHAAGAPWLGLNALDAAVMAYNNVSCLRQQMKPYWMVHGIITNGGVKPNVIPEETDMQFYIRAPTTSEVSFLKRKMIKCFEAAAIATGCEVLLDWEPTYENMLTNETLACLFGANAGDIGVDVSLDEAQLCEGTASTDMGNVSHVVPSIHPTFNIGTNAMNHTHPFTRAAGADEAQPYTLDQAKVLAMTAIDVLYQPGLLTKIWDDFAIDVKKDVEEI